MPKICLLGKYAYPLDTRLRQQASALAKAGIDVHVVCLRDTGEPESEKVYNVLVHRIAPYHAGKKGFAGYLLATLQFFIRSTGKMITLSRSKPFDAIVIHTLPEFLIATALPHKLWKTALFIDLRDITYELVRTRWQGIIGRLVQPIAQIVEQVCCHVSDACFVASPGFRERLIERGIPAKKLHLLMNTADHHVFVFNASRTFSVIERGARLLYHGTVAPRFGVLDIINALAILQATIPESTLTIFGFYDYAYRDAMLSRAHELGLNKHLFLHEAAHHERIYEEINKADFGIVPYINDHFMNLALSTKTFEYVASGLPVVASRLRSSTMLFDDTCITYAQAQNPADFAEKIARLCTSPVLRKRSVAAAETAYRQFSGLVNEATYTAALMEKIGGAHAT